MYILSFQSAVQPLLVVYKFRFAFVLYCIWLFAVNVTFSQLQTYTTVAVITLKEVLLWWVWFFKLDKNNIKTEWIWDKTFD